MIDKPDPTTLTTNAVNAAKQDIEKLFNEKLHGMREVIDEKFSGRDTALAAALKAAQELVKQQNDSNTVAANKAEQAVAKQIDVLILRIDDLKERIGELSRKDWSTVGAYIVGAAGIAAFVLAMLYHR